MANEEKVKAEPSEFSQHVKAAGSAAVKQWKSLIPGEFWEYGREARRETLLAVRSAIDSAINRLEAAEEASPKRTTRRKTKVEVEQS
jgi:hypothetical protein